jgi:hypothetical protein
MDYLSYDYEITIAVLSPTRKVHAPSKKRSRPPLGPAFHQNDLDKHGQNKNGGDMLIV